MTPADRDLAHLWDVLRAGERVLVLTRETDSSRFRHDWRVRWMVERGLLLVGEAVRRLSDEFRVAHPGVPSAQVVAQRNVIVHEYDRLEPDTPWTVATTHLPLLSEQVTRLLPPEGLEVDASFPASDSEP